MKTKMKLIASLKIWVVIYPSITLFLYLFGESLAVLPLYQRTLLLTLSLVPWIVFAGVPFVDLVVRMISPQNDKKQLWRKSIKSLTSSAGKLSEVGQSNSLSIRSLYLTIQMTDHKGFDVIIIGGSYSGLAAGMALGRALRKVLIIDSDKPCNRQTPHSHNFITQDGKAPGEIAMLARQQVQRYATVKFFSGVATHGNKTENGFDIQTATGEVFKAKKLIFATGIRDIMPAMEGYAECWGISVIHCPYCHGYEVRNERTGILGNGDYGFEFSALISNWTKELTLFTNGESTLTPEQTSKLESHQVKVVEKEIEKLTHANGHLQQIIFKDGTASSHKVLYARSPFEQHCAIPQMLGCELTDDGYIKIDASQKTSINGVFACGDNTTRLRTVANAVAMGTTAGMMVNKEIVFEEF